MHMLNLLRFCCVVAAAVLLLQAALLLLHIEGSASGSTSGSGVIPRPPRCSFRAALSGPFRAANAASVIDAESEMAAHRLGHSMMKKQCLFVLAPAFALFGRNVWNMSLSHNCGEFAFKADSLFNGLNPF